MTEQYLHYLWRNRMIPLHLIQSDTGEEVKVEDYGSWNRYGSGPDFLNARVRIGELLWCGHVEMHLKSSDWFTHKHHLDPAYHNVILHVVCDSNAVIRQNNVTLPEIALRPVIDAQHVSHFQKHITVGPKLLCRNQLKSIPVEIVNHEFDRIIIKRITRKFNRVQFCEEPMDPQEVLYRLLAATLGGTMNTEPFLELAKRLPIHVLRSISKQERNLLIRYTSGLFAPYIAPFVSDQNKNNLPSPLPSAAWKKSGMFPAASPQTRILQLIDWVNILLLEREFIRAPLPFRKWKTEIKKVFSAESMRITPQQLQVVYINTFIPYYTLYFANSLEEIPWEQSLFELSILPPDTNHIITLWEDAGVKPLNALQSQAMLEIFNDLCANNRCLQCRFGNFLLR